MQQVQRDMFDPIGDAMAKFRARVQSLEAELDSLMIERERQVRAGASDEDLAVITRCIEDARRRILDASGDRRADPVPELTSRSSSGTIVVDSSPPGR